jgi:serine/threonine-protein kinase RsbW
MAGEYVLRGFAVPATLALLHGLLARAGEEHPDVPSEDLMMFEIAVIELAGNVVEHGQPTGAVEYSFHLEVHDDRLVGTLSDSGSEIPYTGDVAMPETDVEHGRGLPLAEAVLDELSYARADDVNVWRMTRRRTLRTGSTPPG